MSLTILYLGAELALLGVLKDRVVAGVRALHGAVTAGLVEEGAVPTRGRAARRGPGQDVPSGHLSPVPWLGAVLPR